MSWSSPLRVLVDHSSAVVGNAMLLGVEKSESCRNVSGLPWFPTMTWAKFAHENDHVLLVAGLR